MLTTIKAKQLDLKDLKNELNGSYVKIDGSNNSNLVTREEIIATSTTISVVIESSGLTTIDIPDGVKMYPNIHVYHNGKLLVKDIHYSLSVDSITLIDYTTYKDDIFTFNGYGSTGSLMLDDSIFLRKEQILDDEGYIKPALIRGGSTSGELILGETSTTAFRGDLGKIAYEHALTEHAPVNAEENVIEVFALGSSDSILPVKDKKIIIPVSNDKTLGVVKSSSDVNKVFVNTDGTMSINNVSATKLVVPEGEELILVAGNSNKN